MRIFMRVLSVILCIFSLSGCSSIGYQIYNEDSCYIILDEKIYQDAKEQGVSGCSERPFICFNSLNDMKSSILSGDLTHEELVKLASFSKDRKISVCDLDALYDPSFPANHYDKYQVKWYGSKYDFKLENESTGEVCYIYVPHTVEGIHYIPYKAGLETLQIIENNIKTNQFPGMQSAYSVSTDPIRNATVYSFLAGSDDDVRKYSYSFYSFEVNSYHYTIMECEEVNSSGNIRYSASICITDGKEGMYVTITHRTEPLTTEFISSFGFEKYKG